MKIGLIPLDERPVNTRYPVMIGEVAGVEVDTPPHDILSHFRNPADCDAIAMWLRANVDKFDVLIVSIEMLVYGGLVPSRITDDKITVLLQRLEILREIKRQNPDINIFGFNLITRISKNSESKEEPSYWHEAGAKLYKYSQEFDEHAHADGNAPERPDIIEQYLGDLVQRRMRNHMVNLAVLDLLADDVFDVLVISSDDTSQFGFGTREKQWVNEWVNRRGGDERLLMYPGADEVGAALLARAIVGSQSITPQFFVQYAIEEDRHRIAPFEDGPVSLTVERQIRAVGGIQVDSIDDANLIVAVNPPAPSGDDFFNPVNADGDRKYRQTPVQEFVAQIKSWLEEGHAVIVCDVAYPNGSDPVLIEAMQQQLKLTDIVAYGAWNTAGNTIGTALAQGIASIVATDNTSGLRFLVHRFVEDYCYMHIVRQSVSAITEDTLIAPDDLPKLTSIIQEQLNQELMQFDEFRGWTVTETQLPWSRLFEVDFVLEKP